MPSFAMTDFQSTTATTISLENERLRAELRAGLEELRACRDKAMDAAEATRRRIERNLHDGIQQRLVSLAMSLGLLDAKLPAEPEAAKPIARQAREALALALHELRELSQGIYPSVLAERGLTRGLEELCERAAVTCNLRVSLQDPPSTHVAAAAYFVVSEALTNVAKHAHARTTSVVVYSDDGELIVEIHDDGMGGAATGSGSGLRGMTDRIEALGGRMTVSSPLGRGTSVRAEIPYESSDRIAPGPAPAIADNSLSGASRRVSSMPAKRRPPPSTN